MRLPVGATNLNIKYRVNIYKLIVCINKMGGAKMKLAVERMAKAGIIIKELV